jgi:hypothetical protein
MKIKITYLCLFIASIAISCKKDNPVVVGNTKNTDAVVLSQVITDNKPSTEFLYNDARLITEEKGNLSLTVNNYNNLNQLTSSDFYSNFDLLSSNPQVFQTAMNQNGWVTSDSKNKIGSIKYEYNDKGQIINSNAIPVSGPSQYSEFNYNENGKVSKQVLFWDNSISGHIDYSYDVNGNLIKEILYNKASDGTDELISFNSYEYDNQKNPYRSISRLMIPGINTNPNNITNETITVHVFSGEGQDQVQVLKIASAYTYNSTGYPVSKNGNTTYVYN